MHTAHSKPARHHVALAMRLAIFLVLLASLAPDATARAVTCIVDPTGGSPYPVTYPSINNAIASGCSVPGTVIEIWCPAAGCSDRDVVINGLSDITIRSLEVTTAAGGPVEIFATLPAAALRVEASSNIDIVGIDRIQSGASAVEVLDSAVEFAGVTALTAARYTQITGQYGLLVGGASDVVLHGIGFNDNEVGLRIQALPSGEPKVTASGVAFLHNLRAVDVKGPAVGCIGGTPATTLVIASDFSLAWENYFMENVDGIHMHGRALALVDHTIFANNLTQMAPGGVNPLLLSIEDSSSFVGRNILMYDNDMLPGLTPAYAGGFNVAGYLLEHTSCGESTFQASTIVNNGADITFGVGGSGKLTLDHTVVVGNYGKTLSMSGYYVSHGNTCPPLTMSAAYFWNDYVYADPFVCLPPAPGLRLTWNPNPLVSVNTPRTLVGYPAIPAVPLDLYLIRLRQPVAAPLPLGLYQGRPWSVNGKRDDKRRLDVGYHNPK